MITDIVLSLTTAEQQTLRQRAAEDPSQLRQFVLAMLNDPHITKEALEKQFGINENTYFKNLSLAKNEIYEVIKKHMATAYDELMLPNTLYKRGLEVHASKLRLKLEEEYEAQGWWLPLHELYGHELTVAYAKCDLPWMKKVKDKTLKNIQRLNQYLVLDKELAYQMAELELGKLKDTAVPGVEKKIGAYLKDAEKLAHPVLWFNALYCKLLLYTTIDLNLAKAQQSVDEISAFLKKQKGKLFPYVERVALLNLLNFYTNFDTEKKADSFIKEVQSGVGKHGMLYDAQVRLNLCSYYFLQRDVPAFEKYLSDFLQHPRDRSFAYQNAYVNALHAYLKNDSRAFYQYQNEFYSEDNSREYTGYNLQLRYLEITLLLKEKDLALASDKLQALDKFLRRNFSKQQVAAEKVHLQLLRAGIQQSPLPKLKEKLFRLTVFLDEEMRLI
ncbi:MAG: hypothetical protein U0T73_07525 [Chitinophagales bacterium]